MEKAKDDLDEIELIKERNLVEEFKKGLATGSNKVTYGEDAVRKALQMAAVDTVLFSEGIEKTHLHIHCTKCDYRFIEVKEHGEPTKYELQIDNIPCPNCKEIGGLEIEKEEDLIDEIERLANETGAKIEVISTSHENGMELLKAFTGIAALLRYPVDF